MRVSPHASASKCPRQRLQSARFCPLERRVVSSQKLRVVHPRAERRPEITERRGGAHVLPAQAVNPGERELRRRSDRVRARGHDPAVTTGGQAGYGGGTLPEDHCHRSWCSVPQEDGCEIYYAVKFWASPWVRLRMNCTGAPYKGPFTSSTAACTMSSSTPSLLVHDPLGSCLAA